MGGELILGGELMLKIRYMQVADFVLAPSHELYCVAPRGAILARFLVQALVLALQLHNNNTNNNNDIDVHNNNNGKNKQHVANGCSNNNTLQPDAPQAKMRRLQNGGDNGDNDDTTIVKHGMLLLLLLRLYVKHTLLRYYNNTINGVC